MQPFCHNRHGPKIWELRPLLGTGTGSPSNTMWPGPRPTGVLSFIFICPTVWPQYTNVTDRTGKGKEEYLYSAFLHQGTHKALRHGSQFYLKTTPCLPFLRGVHQMSPPQQLRQQTSNCSSLLIYRPLKDERLSWPSWLTYSGWLTHISGDPSATGRAQDSESTSAKDQCSTAGLRHQLKLDRQTTVR